MNKPRPPFPDSEGNPVGLSIKLREGKPVAALCFEGDFADEERYFTIADLQNFIDRLEAVEVDLQVVLETIIEHGSTDAVAE